MALRRKQSIIAVCILICLLLAQVPNFVRKPSEHEWSRSRKRKQQLDGGGLPVSSVLPKDTSYDVCVVGAGLSGAVIAERYATVLNRKVLVLDNRRHIAGNCYDFIDDETGILMNLYGAHLFHTDKSRVWKYINKKQFLAQTQWNRWDHEVKGWIAGQLLPIPVNIQTVNSLFQTNFQDAKEMDTWLVSVQLPCSNHTKHQDLSAGCKSAEEMAMSRVGKNLYDLIFRTYTIKQWGHSAAEMDASVTARIPVRNNFDTRYFADRYQYLPSNGYTKWFASVLNSTNIEVVLNTDYFKVRTQLAGRCGKTYFTGPIDRYFENAGLPKLEYRSLHFETERIKNIGPGYYQVASVVNYPGPEVNFTRIVEYKHFLRQKSQHSVLVREFSTEDGEPYYPVPNEKNRELYAKYQELAAKEEKHHNMHFVGRLANYK